MAAAVERRTVRATVAGRANVELRVLEFTSAAYTSVARPFHPLVFADPNDPGLIYTEHRTGALYIDDPKEIASFVFAFDLLVGASLSRKDSVRLMREAAASHR